MSKSRRQFLAEISMSVVGAAMASRSHAQQQPSPQATPAEPAPGTPPAFGTAPPVGPEVSPTTFAEAEKLVRIELTPAERAQAASNWRSAMAPLYERRTGPLKVEIEPDIAPYSRRPRTRSVHLEQNRSGAAPLPRRGHRLRAGHSACALDRDQKTNLHAADTNLSGPPEEVRSQAALRDHSHF
jgi:hypothetical protein